MKLAILGGGGFRVPLIYRAAINNHGAGRPDVITLYDTSPERLALMAGVLADTPIDGPPPVVESTTRIDEALGGADFVFSAIRVGGLEGRVADERVALDYGVLGQETTGPGGLAFGLRTLPTMMGLAERVQHVCPDAWLINFTNPAGMITEALRTVLGDRVIGICDSPMGLTVRAQRALGIQDATPDYVGLNHLGWLQGLVADGVDHLPRLVTDPAALASFEEGQLFGAERIGDIAAIPNEYLYYYDYTREAIAKITSAPETRAEALLRNQAEFYRHAANLSTGLFAEWNRVRLARNATYMADLRDGEPRDDDDIDEGGYESVAVAMMNALAGGAPAQLILNVPNGDTLDGLSPDAVIEVPCHVDSSGASPVNVSPLTGEQLALVQQVKTVERLTIAAALEGSEALARRAFAAHPLVDSVTVANELFAAYRQRIPELDAVFVGRS